MAASSRVLAILLGPVVAFVLAREAVTLVSPWSAFGVVGSLIAGVLTWWSIHWLAGKAVRVWVVRKGRLNRRKLARALVKRAVSGHRRRA